MTEVKPKTSKKYTDMTKGSIIGCLVAFALPLLVGNFFQQLYNMMDAFVIGQRGTPGEYSAVGSVAPITNILIGLFSGLSSGASVVISQYYGAKDGEKVSRASHTAMALTLVASVLFTALGVIFSPLMVKIMLRTTEGDVYAPATEYLTIYSCGMTFMLLYNMGSGILRAVGDSKRPFYFLAVAAVLNTGLDFLLVYAFDMGVKGVAYATVIAQFVAAVLTIITLFTAKSDIRISIKKIKFDGLSLKQTIQVGIPAAIQLALTAFSNVFVQSYIGNVNADQTAALGGWTTYNKVDQFVFLPLQSLGLAATTFVGQNLGAGNIERAKKGTYCAFFSAVLVTLAVIAPIMIFAEKIAAVFNADPDIVRHATFLLHFMTPFYLCSCVNQVFSGAMRGAGNSVAPMIIMMTSFIVVRQIYLFVVSTFISNDFLPIAFGYPAGWIVCCVSTLVYFFAFFRFDKHIIATVANAEEEAVSSEE
ncbi:MAG: MATE family efflux transporter [Firmicutes bacterium]|nr:MATE family efflux transporter [Bacillota bacterium]MDY5530667.1 MATE family efflux transporter [Pumilibacteraceae bacterium]